MKIAQIAPLIERVPPKKYGGTERIVHVLTEELVRRGHDVTLFASGDSQTTARLISGHPVSLREAGIEDQLHRNSLTLAHATLAYDRSSEFDVIHDHVGVLSLPLAHTSSTPVVATLHGAFFNHNIDIFRKLHKPHYVTISDDQAKPIPDLHTLGTVYNGLPLRTYPFSDSNDGYLLNVGRITPQKGTHLAVELARKLQLPLIIAAKLEPEQREYFEDKIQPYLSNSIQWIGEIDEDERNVLMSKALAFLHPAPWREPFGLTLIEAMATGCPVVALRRGAIPEIVEHGKTGVVADDVDGLAEEFPLIYMMNRRYIRNYVLGKFSEKRMVNEYEHIYELVTSASKAIQQDEALSSLQSELNWSKRTMPQSTAFTY